MEKPFNIFRVAQEQSLTMQETAELFKRKMREEEAEKARRSGAVKISEPIVDLIPTAAGWSVSAN